MGLLNSGRAGSPRTPRVLPVADVPLHIAYAALGERRPAPVGAPLPYLVTCPQCERTLYVQHTRSAILVLCSDGCATERIAEHLPRLVAHVSASIAVRSAEHERLVRERAEQLAREGQVRAELQEREERERVEREERGRQEAEELRARLDAERAAQIEREAKAREVSESEEREVRRTMLAASLRPKVKTTAEARWLITNVLGRGVKQLVVAPSFGGKSLLEYSKAIAIAGGVPWLGHATRRARVLIIALDGTAGDDHLRRLRGLAMGMSLDFDQLVNEQWLMFYDPAEPLHLDNPERVDQLRETLDALDEMGRLPEYIVLDNLTRARGNRAINAGNDPGVADELWSPIEELAARGITTSVLHHSNKRGGVLGSEMNAAAADLEIHLDRQSKRPDAWISITGVSRDPCRTEMTVRFVGGVGADGVGDGSPIRIEERAAKHDGAPAVSNARAGDDVQRRTWLLAALPSRAEALYDAMAKVGVRRDDTLALRKAMADEGLIALVGGLWSATTNRGIVGAARTLQTPLTPEGDPDDQVHRM